MDDEDAFKESQFLREHACHRALQSHRDAARQTDKDDEEDRFHAVVLWFEFER